MSQRTDELFMKEAMSTDRAIPGESLTADPSVKTPLLGPPEFTKKSKILEYYFEYFTSEEMYEPLLDTIEGQIPLIDIVKVILMKDLEAGLFNPDLMLLIIEPLVYMLAALAERQNIDFVIDDDRDGEGEFEEDEEDTNMFSKIAATVTNPEMGEEFPEEVQEQLESDEPLPAESLLNRPEEGQSLLGAR
tara:strand:+ start:3895 stop:4464 length:570 start_codon:yes stop_codon:yes gene_type:complete